MAIHHRARNIDSPLLGEGLFRTGSGMGSGSYKKARQSGARTGWALGLLAIFGLACVVTFLYPDTVAGVRRRQRGGDAGGDAPPVLVSYSYFEKDGIQVGGRRLAAARREGRAFRSGSCLQYRPWPPRCPPRLPCRRCPAAEGEL